MGRSPKRRSGKRSGGPEPTPSWQPITDSVQIKRLAKLIEELNELGSVAARCLAQGVEGINPDSGKSNRRWLEEEIADVIANVELVHAHYGLDQEFIQKRAEAKQKRQLEWQP